MCDDLLLEERVDKLEDILGRFILSTESSLNRLTRELIDFKDETRKAHRKMNQQWGGLANRLGTLVEDIVSPAVRPAIRKYFNCEVTDFMIRRKCTNPKLGLTGEFDVIAISDDRVFVVEAKTSPDRRQLRRFAGKAEVFRALFPEYHDRHLTLIFASLRFDEDLISLASREHIYVLAYREWDYMDILNFEAVEQIGSGPDAC